jgi:hypothetical protein
MIDYTGKAICDGVRRLIYANQKISLAMREGARLDSKALIELIDLNTETWQHVLPVLEVATA